MTVAFDPYPFPEPTPVASARPTHLRAIQSDMPDSTRTRAPRPPEQAAQLACRMSIAERASIVDAAAACGLSVPAYLLELHTGSRRGSADLRSSAAMVRNSEEPGPIRDRAPLAKAGHAIAVAAG